MKSQTARQREPCRILVVMPTWLGDCVMATPALRALRRRFPDASITALIGRNIRPILDAFPHVDRLVSVRDEPIWATARRLRMRRFDLAVLLRNSFRSALLVRLAGVARRLGYDRDGRRALLSEMLTPPRDAAGFTPVPAVRYYLRLVESLGAEVDDATLELGTHASDDALARRKLRIDEPAPGRPRLASSGPAAGSVAARGAAAVDRVSGSESESSAETIDAREGRADADTSFTRRPLLILNPGSAKAEKRWAPERFAALADRCVEHLGARVALSGAPSERAVLDAGHDRASCPLEDLPRMGVDLRLLKSVLREADLLVTNDTGTRHVAAAMGTSVVTIFGPTDPAWTEIDFAREEQVTAPVTEASRASARGSAMRRIEPEMVFDRVVRLLRRAPGPRTNDAVSA